MTLLDVLLYEAYSGKATGNIRYLLDLARHASRNGIRLHVVVPAEFALLDEARDHGVACTVLPPGPHLMRYGGSLLQERGLARARTALAMARYWSKMRELAARVAPDVLLANNLRSHLLAAPAAWSSGIPAVWYVTGETESVPLGRLAFRIAARVLFQSERTIDQRLAPRSALQRKVAIVPNGIDVDRILAIADAGCPDLEKPAGEIWITCVGTLSPLKGTATLLDAFARIARADPRLRLLLVGDADRDVDVPFVSALRQRAMEAGISERVRFLGWRHDAPAVVALSDVVVHPSLSEGMPKAVIEAMVVGRPVVASAVGGIPDFVREGVTGILVPPGDAAALAQGLERVAQDPALRAAMGAAAMGMARERTIDANIRALAAVLGEVAAPNGSSSSTPTDVRRR